MSDPPSEIDWNNLLLATMNVAQDQDAGYKLLWELEMKTDRNAEVFYNLVKEWPVFDNSLRPAIRAYPELAQLLNLRDQFLFGLEVVAFAMGRTLRQLHEQRKYNRRHWRSLLRLARHTVRSQNRRYPQACENDQSQDE